MTIKMIVTDLDGTFYHHDFTYDRKRFNNLYSLMKEDGIRFVVASGNQYYQLISFFDHPEELTFAAENGGYVVDRGEELFSVSIQPEIWKGVIQVLDDLGVSDSVAICGKKSAYVMDSMSDPVVDIFRCYFPVIRKVSDVSEIDDQIIKMSILTEETVIHSLEERIREQISDQLRTVTSGQTSIDLVVKDINKGKAIQLLMDRWNICSEEVMAFGDAMNDAEMLKTAGYGFVMANGNPLLKEQFKNITEFSNDEDGEFIVLEEYFSDREAFLEKYR